jgi:phenylalanyl-tRNA synthetase alpha chain
VSNTALLDDRLLRSALDLRDLTDPGQGPHALQLLVDDVVASLARASRPFVDVRRGDRVVTTADNYDNLGYEPDAVSRDARYTKYVDSHRMLRSHTSALIPPALRSLRAADHDDVLIVAPGVCYRRDSIDWQHTGNPHQVDLWRISRHDRLSVDELVAMIDTVVGAALPGARWRAVPSVHPYTDEGRQVDAYWNGQWIEIGECGLAATHVLARAGLGVEWTGLAMGVGLDRLLMLRKGIPDIRLLRADDARIAAQMLDLAPYRVVSGMPPIVRDISVAVGSHQHSDDEAIGDLVRDTLGDQADLVESTSVIQRTSYDDVPPAARRRLGIEPGQHNLLIRVVLRAMDRTLTNAEANHLRNRVYATLHQGSPHLARNPTPYAPAQQDRPTAPDAQKNTGYRSRQSEIGVPSPQPVPDRQIPIPALTPGIPSRVRP